ncbi:MarR family winged helix-turn-helix transcriptional regulator [Chitinophaga sp. NPDC101104]|uniref:MarR family winged helix-turn-helix transcriptional regulator n=1 Tax=Chitinophaga sp. NPDC101104 TaxID=3390561 RepID=UPI003D0606A3
MNIVHELEELALATRLKRLGERLSQDVSRIYKESSLDFEARWFLILELLSRKKTMSITEISDALQISHPAVVQLADQMLEHGLMKASPDPRDARRRLLSLSASGKNMYKRIGPMLQVIREENRKWLLQSSGDLLRILGELENALDDKSMYQRIREGLSREV